MVYACLGVICHLHFWQNERGILRATAVTRGWNGHQRVSTQSWLWRRKFSCRSCRDSNSQPFDHESGALTNQLSRLPTKDYTGAENELQSISQLLCTQVTWHWPQFVYINIVKIFHIKKQHVSVNTLHTNLTITREINNESRNKIR